MHDVALQEMTAPNSVGKYTAAIVSDATAQPHEQTPLAPSIDTHNISAQAACIISVMNLKQQPTLATITTNTLT